MSIFAVGIAFALLLGGVSLLFIPRRANARTDWPSFLAMTAAMAALVFLSWLWQYSKFVEKFGIFYWLSPNYGGIILSASEAILFIAIVKAIWKDMKDQKE